MSIRRISTSGPHHGWRASKGIPVNIRSGETLSNFGPPTQQTINRGLVSKRLKRVKVTLPPIKAMTDEV